MLYSKRFYTDRESLLVVDLGIDEKYKKIIEKHIKYFANKDRVQRFYDLEIRVLFTDDTLEDNKYIVDFPKYDLLDSFWKCVEQQFGFTSSSPALEKFLISVFVTYADRYISCELPKGWKSFVSYKSGNIIAFMYNLMYNVLYRDKYDELSAYVAGVLDASSVLSAFEPENLIECDSFADIDRILIHWIVGRLLAEDLITRLGNKGICRSRQKGCRYISA